MEKIACIDIKKYSVVAADIRSPVVILTENQKEHIIKRRGKEFFVRCYPYFQEVAEDPDYIFRDKAHPKTAIVSKTISFGGENINLVIRLATADDETGLENSIITAIVENDRRYSQRLRNNIPLYKKE